MAAMKMSRGAKVAAGVLVLVLVATAGRYGFHRDELYFIEGGRHAAWAQPDNPILVPLLATAWHSLVHGNLWAFRLIPALVAGLTVLVAALTAQAFGGSPHDQTAAAVATASTSIVPATGHLFSITTFDIFLTSLTLLLLIRALRQSTGLAQWMALGVVAGITLEVKVLLGLVLISCLLAMVLIGPRAWLRKPGPWLAGLIAAVIALPNLVWQGLHGWPMLEIARNIAGGGSTSSASRSAVVYLHLLLVGPIISIVLITGLVVLVRRREGTDRSGRPYAWITLAYLIFLIIVIITGGKPYYLAGFFPAVLAAGAGPVLAWATRSAGRKRVAAALLVVSWVVTAFLTLPLAPGGSPMYEIAVAVNPDAGETVGWNSYVQQIQDVAETVPADQRRTTIILAGNYGEAGAISRARRMSPVAATALPPVYSGHNAFAYWGPPPESASTAIVAGKFSDSELGSWFDQCRKVAQLASPPGADNEEAGAPIRLCTGRKGPWVQIWPMVSRLA
jgi:4-amino-4-deoxy-L-arabinose transferase-like glycosyltransferase